MVLQLCHRPTGATMSETSWPLALARSWHPIAYRSEVKKAPLAVVLMGRPLVVFETVGGVAVLEDRCPHRNVPLSAGRVVESKIECPYHGWRFDAGGRCRYVAGSNLTANASARSFSVHEHAGIVWTCLTDEETPFQGLPDVINDLTFDTFWWHLPSSTGAVDDAIENLLDPVHAYFLHPGLVRKASRACPVDVELRVNPAEAVARYTEPHQAMTLLQRLTEGRRSLSWGRYRPPTQVQIGFEDSQGLQASISVIFSPVDANTTRPFAAFSTSRGVLPPFLKRLGLIAFHRKVLSQDLAMLSLQSRQLSRFGGADYHQGPVDMFGPLIAHGLNAKPLPQGIRTFRLFEPV